MRVIISLLATLLVSCAYGADMKVCIGRFNERCFNKPKASKQILDAVSSFEKASKKAKTTFTRLSMCATIITIKRDKIIEPYCLDRLGDKESRRQRDELIAKLR